jgi:hypothetical protein
MSVSRLLRAEAVQKYENMSTLPILSFTLGRHSSFDAVHDLGRFYGRELYFQPAVHDLGRFYGRESQFTAAHSPKRRKDKNFCEYYIVIL